MKTQLPMPQQSGFRVWLPARVRLAAGTQIEHAETGIELRRNEFGLTLRLAPDARDALLAALAESNRGMATNGIATVWRQLLEKLAAAGMLADCAPPSTGVSGLDAVRAVLDKVSESMLKHSSADTGLSRLIEGRCGPSVGVKWLYENYHFTKSAKYHISPVLDHDMSSAERRLWTRFLEDESWHWRIYRPAAAQFGLGFADLDAATPAASTTAFIELLRAAAVRSPVAYAAAMIFIEKPPVSPNVAEHPMYSSLSAHYGFTPAAIRPLWWHQMENLTAGHSGLSAVVISNRRIIDHDDVEAAVSTAAAVVRGSREWFDDLFPETVSAGR